MGVEVGEQGTLPFERRWICWVTLREFQTGVRLGFGQREISARSHTVSDRH